MIESKIELLDNDTKNYIDSFLFRPKNRKELVEAIKLIRKNKKLAHDKFGTISNWDTTMIDDMNNIFSGFKNFNENINDWNVSNVKNMEGMFKNAENFNSPLDNWDVSKVENMDCMFLNCKNFNQNIISLDLKNLQSNKNIFLNCKKFNNPLNNWKLDSLDKLLLFFGIDYDYYFDILKNNNFETYEKDFFYYINEMNTKFSENENIYLVKLGFNNYINDISCEDLLIQAIHYDNFYLILELFEINLRPSDFSLKCMTIALDKDHNLYETVNKYSPYQLKEEYKIESLYQNDTWCFIKKESKYKSFNKMFDEFCCKLCLDNLIEKKI